jgi:glycosyltransferase involved in cell wall biosynthesis
MLIVRVAFTLIGGQGWTGGVNYLENLLSALSDLPNRPVSSMLFIGEDADSGVVDRLRPYLSEPPIVSPVFSRSLIVRIVRLFLGFFFQRDRLAEQLFIRNEVDLVFQHQTWYGCRFTVPTLAWIADFQHRRLPLMFSRFRYLWRDFGYMALSHCSTGIMVSSEDARNDCKRFYPESRQKVFPLPFAVRANFTMGDGLANEIHDLYTLPEKFFYLPNQFWMHKNHLGVVEALRLLRDRNSNVVVVSSGSAHDSRHPKYPASVLSLVEEYNLGRSFKYLGFIPGSHVLPLMKLSAAVLNPSFFEGWSTTVEEAKAIGAPLLLSNIPIHLEQTTAEQAAYFDPYQIESIAGVLEQSWARLDPGPRPDLELLAIQRNSVRRTEFASGFARICGKVLGDDA